MNNKNNTSTVTTSTVTSTPISTLQTTNYVSKNKVSGSKNYIENSRVVPIPEKNKVLWCPDENVKVPTQLMTSSQAHVVASEMALENPDKVFVVLMVEKVVSTSQASLEAFNSRTNLKNKKK